MRGLTGSQSLRRLGPESPPSARPGGVRVDVAGCLLDPEHPLSPAGESAYRRAEILLAELRASPFVRALTGEHFDGGHPGILRFEVTLEIAPGKLS